MNQSIVQVNSLDLEVDSQEKLIGSGLLTNGVISSSNNGHYNTPTSPNIQLSAIVEEFHGVSFAAVQHKAMMLKSSAIFLCIKRLPLCDSRVLRVPMGEPLVGHWLFEMI